MNKQTVYLKHVNPMGAFLLLLFARYWHQTVEVKGMKARSANPGHLEMVVKL